MTKPLKIKLKSGDQTITVVGKPGAKGDKGDPGKNAPAPDLVAVAEKVYSSLVADPAFLASVKGEPGDDGEVIVTERTISAEEIRNKLESLSGSSRLSAKAIKGIEEIVASMINAAGIGSAQGTDEVGATAFSQLTDVPASYSGQGGKVVKVKSDATGLEFGVATDTDEKVSVSANDTTPGYLNGKLVAGTGITLTENGDGGDETLTVTNTLDLSGYVPYTGAASDVDLGAFYLESAGVRANSSAGGELLNAGGGSVLAFGQGGGVNATAYGGWNFDGATADTIAYFGASKTLSSATVGSTLSFSSGTLGLNLGNANTWTAQQTFSTSSTSTPNTVFQPIASQTADTQVWRNISGTQIGGIDKNGFIKQSVFRSQGNVPGMIRGDTFEEHQSSTGAVAYWDIRNDGLARFNYGMAINGWLDIYSSAIVLRSNGIFSRDGASTDTKLGCLPSYWYTYTAAAGQVGMKHFAISGQTADITQWVSGLYGSTVLAAVGPTGQWRNRLTTTQQQWEYDASNYANITVGSTGGVTFDAVGSGAKFTFSDKVDATAFAVAGADGASGSFTTADAKTVTVTNGIITSIV